MRCIISKLFLSACVFAWAANAGTPATPAKSTASRPVMNNSVGPNPNIRNTKVAPPATGTRLSATPNIKNN